MKTADLYLEREELLDENMRTGTIKVDKQIFNDFNQDSIISIIFVDYDEDDVRDYQMVSEDADAITMEYIG